MTPVKPGGFFARNYPEAAVGKILRGNLLGGTCASC
jgi:hypothetical protein